MPDDTVVIPVEGQGESSVSNEFDKLHEQNMAGLGNAATRLINDATTVSKASDYDYLEGKDMVDLAEALGAREVASEKNPGGPSKP